MTMGLRVAMACTPLPFAGLLYLHFLRQGDFSALSIGRWTALGVVSLVMPCVWALLLDRRLRNIGIVLPVGLLIVPIWCAAMTAVLAVNLTR